MTRLFVSYVVWSAWLLSFLALEIPAAAEITPWMTLSGTSQHAENTYPLLTKVLFGFLLGLSLHITMRIAGQHYIPFWRAILFGLIVSFAAIVLRDPAIP